MADGTPFPGFKRGSLDNEIVHPDLYASEEIHNIYARLRCEDPVHWTEPDGFRPFWAVTKHADILEIERQNQVFINSARTYLSPIAGEEWVKNSFQKARPPLQRLKRKLDPAAVPVLVVEDHDASRRLVMELLRASGFGNLYFARDAEAAIGLIAAHPPDLMIVDWNLPGMTGLELVESMRCAALTGDARFPNPQAPIGLLTHHLDHDDDSVSVGDNDPRLARTRRPPRDERGGRLR